MYYCITPCLYGADSTISMPPTITAVHGSIGLYPGRSNRSTWVPIERCKFSRMKRGIAVMSPNRIQKLQQLGFELSWYESKCILKTRLTNTAAPANSEMGATVGNRPRDGRSHQVERTYIADLLFLSSSSRLYPLLYKRKALMSPNTLYILYMISTMLFSLSCSSCA
jgi:hypothetical protein